MGLASVFLLNLALSQIGALWIVTVNKLDHSGHPKDVQEDQIFQFCLIITALNPDDFDTFRNAICLFRVFEFVLYI